MAGPAGLDVPGWAMTEQVRTIARGRVVRQAGRVGTACLADVMAWAHRWLA